MATTKTIQGVRLSVVVVVILLVGMGTQVEGIKLPGFWIPIPIPSPATPAVVVPPTTCPATCCRTYCGATLNVCDTATPGMCTDASAATPMAVMGPCLDAATAGCDAATCATATCVGMVCPTTPAPVFCT